MFLTGSLFGPLITLPADSVFTGPTNWRSSRGASGPTGAITFRVNVADSIRRPGVWERNETAAAIKPATIIVVATLVCRTDNRRRGRLDCMVFHSRRTEVRRPKYINGAAFGWCFF